jgi:hypothetical protein
VKSVKARGPTDFLDGTSRLAAALVIGPSASSAKAEHRRYARSDTHLAELFCRGAGGSGATTLSLGQARTDWTKDEDGRKLIVGYEALVFDRDAVEEDFWLMKISCCASSV